MMNCETFKTSFHVDSENAAHLTHVRTCDRCLDFAATVDPDVLFRALGGEDLIPPGGVDAFVDDVMRQVRVRGAENIAATPKVVSWPRRLAMAATVAAAVTGATLVVDYDNQPAQPERRVAVNVPAPQAQLVAQINKPLITKSSVESYESDSATILEVPSESTDDTKIVMIFDENLPADL